jgi:DtxR family Mn-dependent transcriptional regulator
MERVSSAVEAYAIEEGVTASLQDLEPGDEGRFVRVSDADPSILRHLDERGIRPGASFAVTDKQPFDGPVFACFGEDVDVQVLGGALARAMRVETPR